MEEGGVEKVVTATENVVVPDGEARIIHFIKGRDYPYFGKVRKVYEVENELGNIAHYDMNYFSSPKNSN